MMNKRDRIYIALGTYFLATLGLFFTGSIWWYLIIMPAIIFVILGGKKHV